MSNDKKSFTRREMIVTGTAALTAPLLISNAVGTLVHAQTETAASSLVEITAAGDSTFAQQISNHFPGLLQDPGFQQLMPLVVLVRNTSGQTIRAFSTRWTIATSAGATTKTLFHYFHPTVKKPKLVHFGRKGNKTRFTGSVGVLKQNSIKLISPFFSWSPAYFRKNPTPDWEVYLSQSKSRDYLRHALKQPLSASVQADAVITSDLHLSGPDKGHLARHFRITRNAEHDEALDILRLVKSGASTQVVKETLRQHASGVSIDRSDKKYLYKKIKQRQAKILLRRLNRAGQDKFVRTLVSLQKKRKTTVGLKLQA